MPVELFVNGIPICAHLVKCQTSTFCTTFNLKSDKSYHHFFNVHILDSY